VQLQNFREKQTEINSDSRLRKQNFYAEHHAAPAEDPEVTQDLSQPPFCSAGGRLRLPTTGRRAGGQTIALEKRGREKRGLCVTIFTVLLLRLFYNHLTIWSMLEY